MARADPFERAGGCQNGRPVTAPDAPSTSDTPAPVDGVGHLPAVRSVDDELALAIAESSGGKASREQLTKVLTLATRSARTAGVRAVTSGKWLADVSLDAAAHLSVRDELTLKEHFPGLDERDLAGALIRNASLSTAAVGGVTGALAAASQLHPASWTALPFELLGETLVVVAIEMKLVAELHEVAHQGMRGTVRERGFGIATAWSESRGLRPSDLVSRPLRATAADLVGRQTRSALASQLRKRIMMRAGRNLTTMAPLLAGAAAGAELNRRATRSLGKKVASSLGVKPPR